MFSPDYLCPHSLMDNKVKMQGNIDLASSLSCMVRQKYIGSVDLYNAQEALRNYCIDTYGTEFYEKNAEAISFIVENEYCNKEREERPFFDKKRYEEDMQNGVMY